MRIKIHKDTLQPMIELCRRHKENNVTRKEVEKMFEHHDYQIEFARYGTKNLPVSNIAQDEFINYFMCINDISIDDISNPRLKDKHPLWMSFFNDMESFTSSIDHFFQISEEEINHIEMLLSNAFPSSVLEDIEDIECLFTLSIGNSMGYPYKSYIHFDYLNLGLVKDKETFINFIAHEVHHIIYSKFMSNNLKRQFTAREYFLFVFSYEGLAVKFCNNGTGSMTKPMYGSKPNIGMISDTWDFYIKEFDAMFDVFLQDYKTIKEKNLSLEETQSIIDERWNNPRIQSFIDGKEIEVMHYRPYYLGMQLYGYLYQKLGLNQLFKLLSNPEKLVEIFEDEFLS